MIFSLLVSSQSWVWRSRSNSGSVEARETLTSLVMSGDCGAELRVSPDLREGEAENCTAVNSASLQLDISNYLSIHKTTLRNHLRSKLFVTRIFLSMRRPPYFWRTKNFQYSLAVAPDTVSLPRMASSAGSRLPTIRSLVSRCSEGSTHTHKQCHPWLSSSDSLHIH